MKTFLLLLASVSIALSAADYPSVIRIGYPGVGNDGYSPIGTSTAADVGALGLLDEEFKKEGITFEWTYFAGAGPGLNEALANGLIDFASGLGDLPAIVHKAGGVTTEILAVTARRQNTYILVPNDSKAKSLQDLKGQRLALFKGTNASLAWAKILADEHLTDNDFKVINMDAATSRSAIATKDLQGYIGGSDVFQVRNRGAGKIVYTTVGRNPYLGRFSTLNVTEAFEKKYPEVVQRLVNVYVKQAAWESDEANRRAVFLLWAKSGQPWADFKEDFGQDTLASHNSPLLDEHFFHHFTEGIRLSREFKFVRNDVDLNTWVNPKYLNEALKELKLEGNWQPYDGNGNLKVALNTPKPAEAK